MAGIGFELQKALERKTYTAYLQAYFTAAAYSSGPWICTLIALVLISGAARPVIGVRPVNEFTGILVYVYAASLLISGPIQLVLTRFVADCLYKEDPDGILSAVLDALALAAGISALAGYLFGLRAGAAFPLLASSTALLVTVTCLWIVMAYLTAVKQYRAVTGIFVAGAVLSVCLAIGLALHGGMGARGLVLGYTLGHAAMLAGLFSISTFEFKLVRRPSRDFYRYFATLPGLAAVGFFMNVALWADKFLVWGMRGFQEVPGLYSNWAYDIPVYLAYLSVMPSQAFFLIKVETNFEQKYQRFLTAVLESPGEVVVRRKEEMNESLRDGLAQLFKFQGVLSLVVLLMASDLLIALRLHTLSLPLFQLMLLGAYCHFGLLHVLVFLMYLDRRKEMLQILGLFLVLDVGLTVPLLQAYPEPGPAWALGYTVAGGVALMWALRVVLQLAERIDYHLLFRQDLRDADQRRIGYRAARA